MIHNSPWPTVVLPESSVHDLGTSPILPFSLRRTRSSEIDHTSYAVWSNPNRVADSAVAIVDGPTGRTLT
jgi:hypothetical protein